MAKHNNTGRSKAEARFVQIQYYILDSFAWSQLSVTARSAWIEIAKFYNGSNNGRLAVSARTLAARLNVGTSTAARAVKELRTYGFLEITKASSFAQRRQAAEYRLTHLGCDVTGALATKAFMKLTKFEGKPNEAATAMTGTHIKARRSFD